MRQFDMDVEEVAIGVLEQPGHALRTEDVDVRPQCGLAQRDGAEVTANVCETLTFLSGGTHERDNTEWAWKKGKKQSGHMIRLPLFLCLHLHFYARCASRSKLVLYHNHWATESCNNKRAVMLQRRMQYYPSQQSGLYQRSYHPAKSTPPCG
jgi:hypothetical protein